MPNTAQQGGGAPGLLLPVLAGAVLGPTLQLQQPMLWSAWVYAAFGLAALVTLAWAAIKMRASGRRALLALLAALALTAATCGLRAQWFAASALQTQLR